MLYAIPQTQPDAILSCEVTEEALVLHLQDRIDRIAREKLETEALIQTYGAALAAERLVQSHAERTYAWINWQVAPLFACTIGIGALAALWSGSLLIGLLWTLFIGSGQWTIHTWAYESLYRFEDSILFKNIDQGLLNLRRIEALDLQELDRAQLTHKATQIQSLVNAALVARRIDPTVSEKILSRLINSLFVHDDYICDI